MPPFHVALTVWGFGALLYLIGFFQRVAPAGINMGNMLGGMVMQPAVGWVLDRYWHGTVRGRRTGLRLRRLSCGFSLMLAWLVLAIVLVLFTRETRCRQTP